MARQFHPISLVTMARTLGTKADLASLENGNVNKYARYKGLNSNVIGSLTEEQMFALNYGISVNNQTVWQRGADIGTLASVPSWTINYVKPTTMRRLTDWCGYNDGAEFPIMELVSTEVKANANNQITLQFGTTLQPAVSVPMQCYVNGLSNRYLGVILEKGSTKIMFSEAGHMAADYSLLNARLTFNLPSATFASGTYTAMAFISNDIFHASGNESMAIYGSQVSGLSGVKIMPFPQTRCQVTFSSVTFDAYMPNASTNGIPYASGSRYYLRINLNSMLSGVSYSATFKRNNAILGTKTGSITSSNNHIDYETTQAVYNAIVNGDRTYNHMVTCTYQGTSKTFSGIFDPRS